jgi:hypothetical protein
MRATSCVLLDGLTTQEFGTLMSAASYTAVNGGVAARRGELTTNRGMGPGAPEDT